MYWNEKNGRMRNVVVLLLVIALLAGGMTSAGAEVLEWLFGSPDEEAVPAASAVETPAPTAEVSVKDSQLEDDGMIRVYLKSLGDPQQMHITLAGSYAVEGDAGFYFERDARLALSCVDGNVYMAVSGLTINMGQSLTLTRHRADDGGENGIYIDESEKDALFCGDLKVSADGDGLRPVLSLQVEDYLYGVVAYEMSDSFPIEALKAQAVAARTYALQRKWSAGKKDFDVMDTTADQVYKGYIGDYENVIEAVDATRGVVGVYNGGFATCYYTASNGGQTALASHIWGGTGSDGYLAMREDPYDLENPSSIANSITISNTCEGSATLKSMLIEALDAKMAEEGYGTQWSFEAIKAVRPVNPRFEGSLMCDELAFDIQVLVKAPAASATQMPTMSVEPESTGISEIQKAFNAFSAGQKAVPTVEPALPVLPDFTLADEAAEDEYMTVTVTLSVFEQIKDGLSLGLNSSDYEVVAVETAEDDAGEPESFTIIMRRYGHGVGMSQRGAQWMAGEYGKSWMEILNFYYPGMSVERINWPEQMLTPLEALPDNVGAARPLPTPTPTPAPLPALKAGEYYAQVVLETKSSSLNVRKAPTTSSAIVDQLAHGRRLIVSSEPDAEGWVAIYTAEISGYVKLEYLKAE